MEYVTVYSILDHGARIPWPHIVVGFLVPGLFFLVGRKEGSRAMPVLMVLFALFWQGTLLPISWRHYQEHERYQAYLRAGDCDVSEGRVESFFPMPHHGHTQEAFTLNGVRFAYSDFDESRPGFNNTASHGGPITGGLQVRLHHRDGCILKIEVPKAPPPPAP